MFFSGKSALVSINDSHSLYLISLFALTTPVQCFKRGIDTRGAMHAADGKKERRREPNRSENIMAAGTGCAAYVKFTCERKKGGRWKDELHREDRFKARREARHPEAYCSRFLALISVICDVKSGGSYGVYNAAQNIRGSMKSRLYLPTCCSRLCTVTSGLSDFHFMVRSTTVC